MVVVGRTVGREVVVGATPVRLGLPVFAMPGEGVGAPPVGDTLPVPSPPVALGVAVSAVLDVEVGEGKEEGEFVEVPFPPPTPPPPPMGVAVAAAGGESVAPPPPTPPPVGDTDQENVGVGDTVGKPLEGVMESVGGTVTAPVGGGVGEMVDLMLGEAEERAEGDA